MTPNPILKVLSTFRKHDVKSLLIGGQACIIYGAAEFSRDSDFVILCDKANIERFKKALKALKAELIYVPSLDPAYLEKGHACHFRCKARDVRGLRIDVMSKLKGCEPFDKLWERKRTISVNEGDVIHILGLRDLVQSKKTQRDKDWLMLKRLVENDIVLHRKDPSVDRIKWWFLESRDAASLNRLGGEYLKILKECIAIRPLLKTIIEKDINKLEMALHEEEIREREKDKEYWAPLRKELETMRHVASKRSTVSPKE